MENNFPALTILWGKIDTKTNKRGKIKKKLLCRLDELYFPKAKDDRPSRVSDLLDLAVLQHGETARQIETCRSGNQSIYHPFRLINQ